VAKKSEALVDQWKKKAQLFKTNTVLNPLGDDFTYASDWEWKSQTENFELLIEYINNNTDFNVEAKFATLQEYFDSVKSEKDVKEFPTLGGDFFSYSDRDKHYWYVEKLLKDLHFPVFITIYYFKFMKNARSGYFEIFCDVYNLAIIWYCYLLLLF
jgi:hypothetical protein